MSPKTSKGKNKQTGSPAKTGGYASDSGRPPEPATIMAGPSKALNPVVEIRRRPPRHETDGGASRPRTTREGPVGENPPDEEPTSSSHDPASPRTARESSVSKEKPPTAPPSPSPARAQTPLSRRPSNGHTTAPGFSAQESFVSLERTITKLATVNESLTTLILEGREAEQRRQREVIELLRDSETKASERSNALIGKLDELGKTITAAMSGEMRFVQTNLKALANINSSSSATTLELLRRISAAQSDPVPPAADATTSTSGDDPKPTSQPPLTPSTHIPRRDESPNVREPHKGSRIPIPPSARGNSRHPFFSRSNRGTQSPFSSFTWRIPKEPPGGSGPGGNDGGGGGPDPPDDPGPGGENPGGEAPGDEDPEGNDSAGENPDRGNPGGGPGRGDPGGGDEPPDGDPGDGSSPPGDGGNTPTPRRASTPTGYDWEQLNASGWGAETPRERTPGAGLTGTRQNAFRQRIHEAIKDAAYDVLRRSPATTGSFAYLKTVAAGTPRPVYNGDDDLEVFMPWVHRLMCYFDLHQIVGIENDHNRTTILHGALSGHAQTWYENSVRMGTRNAHSFPPDFITVLLRLADRFITPAAVAKAQRGFDRITYTKDKGIQAYARELHLISKHILLPIDEYTLRRRIVEAIPSSIRNHLIDIKGLSTSTSSVAEWVEATARRERELLEKAAFEDNHMNLKRFAPGNARFAAARATAAPRRTNDDQKSSRLPNEARNNNRASPSGPKVPTKQMIPLSEITCHACGKKGHYRGSRECPKTPSSARIHALALDQESMELETPEDDNEEEETPFDGEDFDGDADYGPIDEETDENGLGAVVAGFHVISESDEELEFDYAQVAALATTGEDESDEKLANDLVSAVKEQYESRGSGQKPPFRGPSAKQLKVDEQRTWASNSNVKPKLAKGPHPKVRIGRCPTSILKVNGTDAFVCWDSGSELDAISPDFVRACGINTAAKETPINVCLATKGSGSTTSYEVDVNIDVGTVTMDHPLEILNLHRYDMILGGYFCRRYNVVIDYGTKLFDSTVT